MAKKSTGNEATTRSPGAPINCPLIDARQKRQTAVKTKRNRRAAPGGRGLANAREYPGRAGNEPKRAPTRLYREEHITYPEMKT